MERLTFEGRFCDIAVCMEHPCPYPGGCTQKQVWERLKAYEDLGDFDRLRELAEADKDGRVVVLPCKVGDTINAIRYSDEKGLYIVSDKVTAITTNSRGYTVKTKSKFYPIKETDMCDFAPISEYPYALADFYVGTREEAEAALKKRKEKGEKRKWMKSITS